MVAQTSTVQVTVDEQIKIAAAECLSEFGLTISDAVRLLLTNIAKEGALPAGLACDPDAYDTWFRAKVQEALNDLRPPVSHRQVMDRIHSIIDEKQRNQIA
jgi:DNA-damage-inducible protein J